MRVIADEIPGCLMAEPGDGRVLGGGGSSAGMGVYRFQLQKLPFSSRGTDLCSPEVNCNCGRTPAITGRLTALPAGDDCSWLSQSMASEECN